VVVAEIKLQKRQSPGGEEIAQGEWAMGQNDGLAPEERAKIIEIQDLLIDRFAERREALARGDTIRVKEIDLEIKNLQREKEEIQESAVTL
jgi:hypothetical protein